MSIEYLVLQAEVPDGPFAHVTAHKLNQSWATLQEALDELGQQGWELWRSGTDWNTVCARAGGEKKI